MLQKILSSIQRIFLNKKNRISPSDPRYIIWKLFQTVDSVGISFAERERLEIKDTSYTYGEVTVYGLHAMLDLLHPASSDVFYDLGSGTGKAVFSAALQYDWQKCVGIEYLPGLYNASQTLLEKFYEMDEVKQFYPDKKFSIEFIQDNFLNVDLNEADIIFVNATTLNPVFWGHLEVKFNQLKSGIRIIVATRKLDEMYFEKLHQVLCPMSWGDCTVFIYSKK